MQELWVAFWTKVTEAGQVALSPFRAAVEAVFGYSPSDIQIWCFLCAVFLSVLVIPSTYGDLSLARRRAHAVGKVVKIDPSDDGPSTPTIEFTDRRGRTQRFDSSLSVNNSTGTLGAEVAVIYDPLNPKIAREAGRPLKKAWNTLVWYAIIAGLFGASVWLDGAAAN